MLTDRERTGAYASEQRRLVRDAVAAEVLAFTPYWRDAAEQAGLRNPTSPVDLVLLPPRPLSSIGPSNALSMRPSPGEVPKGGARLLRPRSWRGRGRGAGSGALDPYKAVQWIIEGDMPIGCTEGDLVRLTELSRRSLELAGVLDNDGIVGLIPPGPTLSSLQLALGARAAGVALAGLAPAAPIEAVSMLGPTVLAGRPTDLVRVLDGLPEPDHARLTTVLSITRAPLARRDRAVLEKAAGEQAAVVELWAPPGVRALWAQCRGGEGVHTWPQTELVEVCGPNGMPVNPGEDGELVWTGLGWRGTTFVRLATGLRGRVAEDACPVCGRTTPRICNARAAAGSSEAQEAVVARRRARSPVEQPVPGKVERPRRTLRSARRPEVEVDADEPADQDEATPTSRPADIVLSATPDDELVIRVAPPEIDEVEAAIDEEPDEGDGVRAWLKDPADIAALASGARLADPPVDLDHLPPVPEVGPDAAGRDLEDAWLPDTGEIDAWPAPVLASIGGLAAWQVEHRRRKGHDELVLHLALADEADLAEVLVALERTVGASQYVVVGEADLAARLAAAEGRRVLDRRAGGTNGDGARPLSAAGRRSGH